jgi:hypothetical protein
MTKAAGRSGTAGREALAGERVMTLADWKKDPVFQRVLFDAKMAEGFAKGQIEGRIESILAILEARGIAVDAETRARIERCTHPPTLEQWLLRAATASTATDVVAP